MRYPAAVPALSLAAGITAGIFLPVRDILPWIAGALALCVVAACTSFLRHRPAESVAEVAIGFALAGTLLGATSHRDATSTPLGRAFDEAVAAKQYQLFAAVEGELRADASAGPNGVTLSIDVARIRIEGTERETAGGAIVGVGGQPSDEEVSRWRAGRLVRLPATLRRPAQYLDPGVPDARRQFAWKSTTLVGSTKSGRLVEVVRNGSSVAEALAAIRADVRSAVAAVVAPWSEESAAVVNAILIGDRTGLDEEIQRRLQEAGTYHVIAISGGNIAIFAAVCFVILRMLRVGTTVRSCTAIAVLLAYSMVVGEGSSVGRATLMAVIYLMAQIQDLRSAAGNVAALSAAALFAAAPLEAVDASFALTFGATLGLIVGMRRLRRPAWMPSILFVPVAMFAASLCAELALLPVAAIVFSRVTAAGLILNFAAIPLMAVVQIAGMAAVTLHHIDAAAAKLAGLVAHLGVQGILRSALLVERWPWLAERVPPPSWIVVVVYYASLIAALAAMSRRHRITAVAICAVAACVIVAAPAPAAARGVLRVMFIDVGQGDAAIVQFPDSRTLSVDAGGVPGASFDIGARVVSPAYWAFGIRRLDYMTLSHGDPDHIGGAVGVFRDFKPREIWEGVNVPSHQPMNNLRALADAAHTPWRNIQALDRIAFGDVVVTAHHPPVPEWERQRVRNDDSEVLELRYGGVSLVFTGDIGADAERTIARSFDRAPVRILKVPHHGSATSSSNEFLNALKPEIAVISDGRGNPFGHPTPVVLERYRTLGAAIFRTDLDGAVMVETDGRTLRLHTYTGRKLTLRTYGR